jgi:hypothetical protein
VTVIDHPHPIHLATRTRRQASPVTLAWADSAERELVVALARQAARQTMNLRTMPQARLVVLRQAGAGLAGWAGMDIAHDPQRPELFSQFVAPAFRGRGLGAILEHVWWTWLHRCGATVAYMRMEADSNAALLEKRLRLPFYRLVPERELDVRFVDDCRRCELYGRDCRRAAFLAVDVGQALAHSLQHLPVLDLDALPLRVDGRTWRPAREVAA